MTASVIDSVVRERLGLDPDALGPHVLDRAIEERMHARGLSEASVYAARVMTEPGEREALAAELTVPETWFFRGGRSLFDRLAAFVADRIPGRLPGQTVRVLSVPCSSGEEPYSLTIALHERFLTPRDFTIDAVDLSERALTRAVTAKYGAFAFREAGPDFRPTYFRFVEDSWELLPFLRTAVRFLPGNLTEPAFLAGERVYDLIVCRNLFIYLTPEARLRAMANIDRLLAIDGRLCMTPAEADRLPPGRFVLEGSTEFGIYRRADGRSTVSAPFAAHQTSERIRSATTPSPPPAVVTIPSRTLGSARQLADTGQLDEARAICEQLLRAHALDADVLALLGVIELASGHTDEAFDALRKALYLVPDHLEAMSHMLGICERRGEKDRAAALRRRIAQAASKEGT